ncbi:MAG: hypothetical protein GTO46_10640 [Gemmatimonadetes bacterium]|nr:hypothetical protein [Gemmatimonadota bacterium]NIO32070.1 hypothetical protein [Gemmatimonadota bacterium]
MNRCSAATFVLASMLIAGTARVASAQQRAPNPQGQGDCVLRQEPNGLIRGRSQPKGCVLVQGQDVASQQAATGPAIVCGETIVYTPNPRRMVLANCARLSGGRMVIITAPPTGAVVEERHFGPLQRRFGPIQTKFGPLERHFGPLERHFGPLERNFGSSSQSKSGGKHP